MQAVNPFLPSWEYIPDGEPHVFGSRIYLFGSHDQFGGDKYCMNDYVCYSADTEHLKEWRYEGVIYRKNQDIRNPEGRHCMWAVSYTHLDVYKRQGINCHTSGSTIEPGVHPWSPFANE